MKENQTFTTFDLVTVVSLGIAVLSLAGAVIASVALDSSVVQARLGAEKIANQILLGGLESYNSDQSSRNPAALKLEERLELLGSSGQLARDPWGSPYIYRIGTDEKGKKVAIVLSGGPNRKIDSPDFQQDERGNFNAIRFIADDVGVLVTREK